MPAPRCCLQLQYDARGGKSGQDWTRRLLTWKFLHDKAATRYFWKAEPGQDLT